MSAGAVSFTAVALAQEPPPVGMRPADVRRDALIHVTIAAMPGERLADGVVLMKDGWIERTGAYGSFDIPAGTTIHDGTGCTVYAGFIDACVRIDSSAAARAASSERGAHWNARVIAQQCYLCTSSEYSCIGMECGGGETKCPQFLARIRTQHR